MTRKTGSLALKARLQARKANIARHKRELKAAGVSMKLPKPTKKAQMEKDEELRKLYKELLEKNSSEEKK